MKILHALELWIFNRTSKAASAFRTFFIICIITALSALLLGRFDMYDCLTETYMIGVLLVSLTTLEFIWGILASISSALCIHFFYANLIFSSNFSWNSRVYTLLLLLSVTILTKILGSHAKLQHKATHEKAQNSEEYQRVTPNNDSEKKRNNLLRAISHDLRAPLSGIVGASSVLLDSEDLIPPEKARALLSGIQEDAGWLLCIAENILSITRISDKCPTLHTTSEPLDELFSVVATKTRKRHPLMDLQIKLPDVVTFVRIDQLLIVQVLVNLIDNAMRHSGSHLVDLIAETEGDYVRISVLDHGCGLSQSDLDNLFDDLSPPEDTVKNSTRGAGIGLSICRTIVECHDGQISARNMPKGGACISFTLPIEEVSSYVEP